MADLTTRDRLKMWRLHRNMTLQEVAKFAGRTKQLIGMIETGAANPGLDVVEAIVTHAFRISMLEFYGPPPKPLIERATRRPRSAAA